MKRKLSYSERGKLGAIKPSNIAKLQKEQRIKEYNRNPKRCLYCNAPISYKRKSAKFCNSFCAAKYNNHNRVVTEAQKEKTSKTIKSKPIREVKCCKCGRITYSNSTNYHNVLCDNCRDINRPNILNVERPIVQNIENTVDGAVQKKVNASILKFVNYIKLLLDL